MTKQGLIEQILETALKVSAEKDRLLEVFNISGITVGENHLIAKIEGSEEEALKKLMANLTEMPVVKISAKQVMRRARPDNSGT